MVSTGNASEIRDLLEIIGGKKPEYLKMWLYRIATASGLSLRVVEDAFNGQYVSKKTAWKLRQTAEKTIANENADTAARFERTADAMEAADSEFHRQEIDTYRELARQIRLLADGAE